MTEFLYNSSDAFKRQISTQMVSSLSLDNTFLTKLVKDENENVSTPALDVLRCALDAKSVTKVNCYLFS